MAAQPTEEMFEEEIKLEQTIKEKAGGWEKASKNVGTLGNW